ncbi:MAG: hypothetical protein WKG00_04835 [Polyangiaceae bacterium]
MSGELTLYATLVAVYLLECLVWVPRGAVAFVAGAAGRARLVFPSRTFSTPRGGVIIGRLLPGTLSTFVVPQWPLSMDARGVLGWVAECLAGDERALHTGAYWRWEDMPRIDADLRKVVVDGETLALLPSARFATDVAAILREVRALPEAERPVRLEAIRRRLFDVAAVQRRIAELETGTTSLRLASACVAAIVFCGLPLLTLRFGLERAWPLALAAVYLPSWVVTVLFVRAHHRISPHARLERWGNAALCALLPLSAVRATDALARTLLHGLHPLAVGVAVLDRPELERFVAALLRDAHHPRHPVCSADAEEAAQVEAAHRMAMRGLVEEAARSAGLDPAAVLRAPEPEEGTSGFCPRCLAQYQAAGTRCEDCGGVPLAPFPAG